MLKSSTTTTKMVNPRQPKIDALLAAIGIGDETVITSSCKGLQLADFYLIVTQVCLKPKPVVDLEECTRPEIIDQNYIY
jgi:hypothetical protein